MASDPVTAPFELPLPDGGALRGCTLAGAEPGYLYLHGLGSVRTGTKSESLLAHALGRGRAFLRYDQRGHGESTGRLGDVTIGELIDDLTRVLAHTGPRRVVGSSLGGLVAAFAAARRPDLVPALCLIAPALGFLRNLPQRLDAEGRLWTSEGISFVVAERVLADARTLDETRLPERLSMPTLIVHGSDDPVVPAVVGQRLFAAIPHPRKQLWLVPAGDHRLADVADRIWPRFDALLPD
ncbi:MAG: alpha/beta fold hydrolase [Planctomycetes bacterium]|nr:alpha/beta fold hydrolase [Planctomycetota bacterium]